MFPFYRALLTKATLLQFYSLTVTVHPRNIPMLIQTAKGNLGAFFFNRLCLMGRTRESVCGPRTGTDVLQKVPRLSGPSSGATFARTCSPTLRSLRRCRPSLRRWLHPGAFTPVAGASASDRVRVPSPHPLVLRPNQPIGRRLSSSLPVHHS